MGTSGLRAPNTFLPYASVAMSVDSSSSLGTSPMSSSAIVAHAVSGSHVLKIDGYSLTKGLGNGKFIKSQMFDIGGHRWYVQYYPDGFAPETADWISIFLGLDHGNAANGVKAKFRISLLDQHMQPVPAHSVSVSQTCTFSSKSPSWGSRKFIKRKDLEESLHLRDDVFSIRCDVTVAKGIVTETISPSVLVPPSDLSKHLRHLFSVGDAADVTFDVGGETFAAHRCILAARSSVFRAELLGPMKEKTADCVEIQDVEAKVFKALLHFSYTDLLPEMEEAETAAMAQHLLVAADKYNMDRLKLICEEKLCSRICSSTVATTLALAEQHGCDALKNACIKFLASQGNLKAAMASEGFEHLKSSCPYVLLELMAKIALW